ncbi:polysaccharide deacetylase family protein [Flavobacteriales bacterium]|nr:polysaccharide deacetylase family protein [Flavobacteriales bacterium]
MTLAKGYLIRPPKAYRWIFPDALFRKDPSVKKVYLTFDDGPHPEVTQAALGTLNLHGVRATFFMLGENAKKHPGLMEEVRKEGHIIGNHGMHHLNGWTSSTERFERDVQEGKKVTESNLFRPPYGKLSLFQYGRIKQTEEIVFWDVISGDFDRTINAEQVFTNVVNNVRNGSIIVMHDSEKAKKNLAGSLSRIIEELKIQGYEFDLL